MEGNIRTRGKTKLTRFPRDHTLSKQSYYMASSASGLYAANSVFWLATRVGNMEWYCRPETFRFVPPNKISPKFKRVHECFLSLKIFSAKVKSFFFRFLCLYGTRKRENRKRQLEWKQRKQKCSHEFKKYVLQQKPANTKVNTKCEKAWRRFCLQKHENREPCDILEDELNLLLCKIFKTVKKL